MSNEGLFLVIGVPSAKNLAFGTPDANALKVFNFFREAIDCFAYDCAE